ncbi:PAS domain S-box protein [Desulfopila sp. IMCC35008]|uniref:PAS domain S-box protein n=1 Tax=Desulfopila sp. IMCC35008 TaxID=2653858 RepID=UPI0013D878F4|nr:PAS domain S-box protein [Desulfopila sp. IMCC35008]
MTTNNTRRLHNHVQLSSHKTRVLRQTLLILLFFAITATVTFSALQFIKQEHADSISQNLHTVMRATKEALHIWLDGQFSEIELLAQHPKFINLASQLIAEFDQEGNMAAHPAQKKLHDFLDKWLATNRAVGFYLLKPDGTNISSSHDSEIGIVTSLSRRTAYFKEVLMGNRLFIQPFNALTPVPDTDDDVQTRKPTMFLAVPVFDEQNLVLAILAIRLDPRRDFSHIAQLAQSGRTGNFYLFNKRAYLLTSGRYDQQMVETGLIDTEASLLNVRLLDPGGDLTSGYQPNRPREEMELTRLAKAAVAEKSGLDVAGYRNFLGVRVVGSWEWDNEYHFGLGYEINVSEAYSPYRTTQAIIILVAAIISILSMFLFLNAIKKQHALARSREILAASEEKFRKVSEAIADAVVLLDPQQRIRFWNSSATAIFGYPEQDVLQRKLLPLVTSEATTKKRDDPLAKLLQQTSAFSTGCSQELQLRDKEGTLHPVETYLKTFMMQDEQWCICTFKDIGERKKAEQTLKQSEKLLKDAQHIVQLGHWMVDFTKKTFQCSDAIYRILELEPKQKDLTRSLFLQFVHPEDREGFKRSFQQSAQEKSLLDIEFRLLLPNGTIKYIHQRGRTVVDINGKPSTSFGTMQDITERKALELEAIKARDEAKMALTRLASQERRFRSLVANLPGAVYRCAGTDRWSISYISDHIELISGYSAADFQGPDAREFLSIIHPDDRQRVVTSIKQNLANHNRFYIEYRIVDRQQSVHWLSEQANLITTPNGPSSIDGYIYDITDRIERENSLKSVTSRLQMATEGGRIGIWDWNIENDDLIWDNSMYLLYGCDKASISNLNDWQPHILDADFEQFKTDIQETIKFKRNLNTTFRIHGPNNQIRFIRGKGKLFFNDSGNAVRMLGVNYDITEAVTAQKELAALNEDLEKRIEDRTEELKKSKKAALSLLQDANLQRQRAEQALTNLEQSQQALIASEENFRGLVESIDDIIWAYDENWKIIYVSPTCLEILGYLQEEVMGKEGMINMVPEDKPIWQEAFGQSIATKKPIKGVECRFQHKHGGKSVYLETNATPIYTPNGDFKGFRGVSRDITSRKLAELDLKKLSRSVDASPASIVITDADGIIEYVNPKFVEVTGYRPDEVIGSKPSILKSGKHPESFYLNMWKTLSRGNEWHGQICNKKKDGTLFWERTSISPIRDERESITHFVAIKEDITKNIEAEKALQKALAKSEEATLAKSNFLANMSHEIRTPMNAIIGMTHLALQTELDSRQKNYLNTVNNSATSLLNIVNDILDFSKIEAGKLEIEKTTFNISETLDNVVAIFANDLANKGLELLVNIDQEIPPVLVGDPLRIGQIFNNLLSNAVKFTEYGEVEISIQLRQLDLSNILLECEVADTGIGMSEEQQKNLFEKFSQADGSTTRLYGGTGLGLSICKELLDLMHGTIHLESAPGVGARFIFTLELEHKSDRRANTTTFKELLNLHDLQVLLIEANPKIVKHLERVLKSFSFQVQSCSGTAQAESMITAAEQQKKPYELIIANYRPNGQEPIPHAFTSASPLPLILMTTVRDYTATEELLQNRDRAALLGKPVTTSALFNAIAEVFGLQQSKVQKRRELSEHSKGKELHTIANAHILLVEDNTINQQVAVELLEKARVRITLASNGQEAITAAKEQPFDLILMDIQMPVMDGISATKHIREHVPANSKVPIVAMTAHAMAGDRERSLEAGMNDHLAKPINPEELYFCLVHWIKTDNLEDSKSFAEDRLGEEHADDRQRGPSLPKQIAGLNITDGLQRVAGNRQLYLSLLRDFLSQTEHFREEVQACHNRNDKPTLQRVVHTLKGVAGSIGARELQQASLDFEREIHNKSDNFQIMQDVLFRELQQVRDSILELLEPVPSQEKSSQPVEHPTVDLAHIKDVLTDLLKLLAIRDMEAESRFFEIRDMLLSQFPQQTQRLTEYMEALDFKNAQIVAREISTNLYDS